MSDQPKLSHTDSEGNARMVDVGGKPVTDRRAVARGVVRMTPQTAALVAEGAAEAKQAAREAAESAPTPSGTTVP